MRTVTVLALKTFDGYVEGRVYQEVMSQRVAELIVMHYFRLLY